MNTGVGDSLDCYYHIDLIIRDYLSEQEAGFGVRHATKVTEVGSSSLLIISKNDPWHIISYEKVLSI